MQDQYSRSDLNPFIFDKFTLYFTNAETFFIGTFMKDIDPLSPVYIDILRKILVKELQEIQAQPHKGSRQAVALIEAILFKIADAEADVALEELLSDPQISTKRKSYEKTKTTNLHQVQRLVLDTITNAATPVSRTEIAELTNLRVATVCARVAELLADGYIKVGGTKKALDTGRQVETLRAK